MADRSNVKHVERSKDGVPIWDGDASTFQEFFEMAGHFIISIIIVLGMYFSICSRTIMYDNVSMHVRGTFASQSNDNGVMKLRSYRLMMLQAFLCTCAANIRPTGTSIPGTS